MGQRTDPRTIRTRQIVVAATVELLLEVGFERITIDSIAERSCVARSTIYRNWPSRADLFIDAFTSMKAALRTVDTGSLRDDLHAQMQLLAQGLREAEWSRLLPSLVSAADQDPELQAAFDAFADARRAGLREIFARGVDRGEILPVEELELVLDRLAGVLFFRRLFGNREISEDLVSRLADAALVEVGYRARSGE